MRTTGLLFSTFISCVLGVNRCVQEQKFIRFYRAQGCAKSTSQIMSWRNFNNVTACMKFARDKGALAFNFSPPTKNETANPWGRSCQILGCPEINNTTNVVFDPQFDYYTAYGDFNITENVTCIKSLGLFALITKRLNYTSAIHFCQSLGADLADILSEFRTNALANILKSMKQWYKAAYVGLDDMEAEGTFRSPSGNFLECNTYRAWAVGHPRPNRTKEDCVILDAGKTWRAINCKIKLPFICEFYPMPSRESSHVFASKDCNKIKNQRKKQQCKDQEELFHVYMNSPRIDQCAFLNDLPFKS